MELFEGFEDHSRVWVYQADRELSAEDQQYINHELEQFVSGWNAHGKQLLADYRILSNRFVILTVDERQVGASGCSIDSSVHALKKIGTERRIDFFNRLKLIVEREGEQREIHYADKGEYAGWNMYDNTITNLGSLRSEWLKTI